MKSTKQISSIQKEFPDLTQSTLGDVLNAHSNNQRKALQSLREMKTQAEREKESKIKELQDQFSCISRHKIIETLEATNWDVDAAIIPLFIEMEAIEKELVEKYLKEREVEQSKMAKPVGDNSVISTKSLESELQSMVVSHQNHFKADGKENPFIDVANSQAMPAPNQTLLMKATPEVIDTGNPITVEWESTSGTTSSYDWIGIFALDQPNKNYLTYEWRGSNEKKGSVTFTAPSTYGIYEFRYIPYGSYQHAAISNQVRVGPQIELTANYDKEAKKVAAKWNVKTSNEYSRSWVGLYEKSQTNNKNYLAWQYAIKPYTEVTFAAPIKPGEYEFRYFSYSYVAVSYSNSIVVEGHDVLEAKWTENNEISAKVSIVTKDPYYDSVWIGLYLTSEQNNKNLKRYKYITEHETEVSFRAPDPGLYEFRLFANKSYEQILKSNPIEIKAEPVST